MPTAVLFVTPLSAASLFHPPNTKCSTVLIKSPPLSIHASSDANAVACRRLQVPPLCATAVAAPGPVGGDLLEISRLGISEQIVSALSRRGITELFPIQRAVLEPALEGRDMIGRAITGSGKTLAFAIPILDKIIQQQGLNRYKQAPSALVLTPTRELARQVQHEFRASAPRLRSTCLYGGIPIINQERTLAYGMDIVVGTPGRIIDLVERSSLDLSEVKFVVLDEADQMLAVGFQEDVERILSYLPARKQCMLFSATMPHWIDNISRKFLRDPLLIDLVGDSDQKLADGISLYSVPSSSTNKQSILPTLVSMYAQGGKSIIFTKTKRDAEVLSRSMERIIGSKALHGDMQQFQRDKTIASFREGRFSALVATDVAARGLDIPNVDLVVHFEIPNSPEIFLHRSGRTGRAGNKGTTVLMFTESQRHMVQSIEQDLGCKFEELRGISGQKGDINSNKFYDNSTGEDLWFSDDSDDTQSGNDRRYQHNSYGNFQRNYRSRGNTQYGDTHRLQRSNAYRNHRSQEGPKSYNFSKAYQSRSPYPPSASRLSPSDKRDHWNARKTEGEFEFSEQSDPFDQTMGSRKYHQKRSGGNQDDFDYFSHLF